MTDTLTLFEAILLTAEWWHVSFMAATVKVLAAIALGDLSFEWDGEEAGRN